MNVTCMEYGGVYFECVKHLGFNLKKKKQKTESQKDHISWCRATVRADGTKKYHVFLTSEDQMIGQNMSNITFS